MTFSRQVLHAFQGAVAILDSSEVGVRDMIECGLMDIAGINRTRVTDAMLAKERLAKEIAAYRLPYIKRAFRYLRDHLPEEHHTIYERSLATWARGIATQDAVRIRTAISIGLTSGDENTDIARRVIGGRRENGANGVTAITRNHLYQLGRGVFAARRKSIHPDELSPAV